MTISIKRLALGSGVKYLLDSIAKGDGAVEKSSPLTRYYAESGTPPGRFLGAGLAAINDGFGVAEGTEVTEEQLVNMLGLCADPITGRALGRQPNAQPTPYSERVKERIRGLSGGLDVVERASAIAQIKTEEKAHETKITRPVAGFDLTFSLPKSISAAWAVADAGTQAVIYGAHQEAIRLTLAYAEQHTFFSRSGTNGVVQEQIRGVVAAGFDHWDSRSGDPQLHTHVVVQNRAQSLDGTWRTLDSRGLFKQVVTLSELHQGIVQDVLTDALGWGWDARQRQHSSVPKWEATGVSDQLQREFSQRSAAINDEKDAQVAAFIAAHGREPTAVEVVRLRQFATLSTRKEKQHRSLAEQTAEWRERARAYVGDDPVAFVASLADRNELPLLRADDFSDDMLRELARSAVWEVSEKRATFTRANILAEIHRQIHGVRFAGPHDRLDVGERTADLALVGVLTLTPPELHHVPGRFKRADGGSKFRGLGSGIYTTSFLLDAEARLMDAGRSMSGPRVEVGIIAAVAEVNLPGKDYALSDDQAYAIEQIATSGRIVDVLVGPAGTGKSTSLAGLRAMWEVDHGPGSVVGLAPSAAAAEVLGEELGIDTENTAKWLTEHRKQTARGQRIAKLEQRLTTGLAADARVRVQGQMDRLRGQRDRWAIKPGQLIMVDEASLAGTFALDEMVCAAKDAGAKVLLVGDWAQLTAVEAGGAFSMLVKDRDLVPELTDVRRFKNEWEKLASIKLRVGREAAIGIYMKHDRIESGTRDDMLDSLYSAWLADVRAGKKSLMIAGDIATVSELNLRSRADRVAAGEVAEHGIEVASGGVAGVGDRVVTRENKRRLATGRRWVKNGDQWTVTEVHDDGSLTVKRANGGGEVVLPAGYVKQHVELGYASTAHRAQGATVDTAHAMVSATTQREVLYVGATRGRESNKLYVDTFYDPDHDTSHGPVRETPVEDVLRRVMANVGVDISAHTTLAMVHDEVESISHVYKEFQTIAKAAQQERWDALIETCGLTPSQAAQVRESEAYGPLMAAMRNAEARGLDVTTAVPLLVSGRSFGDAEDVAAVLHGRVEKWTKASATAKKQPRDRSVVGLIAYPQGVTDEEMTRALVERAEAMERRAAYLVEKAITDGETWISAVGGVPSDPVRRQAWMQEARVVAAFRELHHYDTETGEMVEQARSVVELGDAQAAAAAAERARRLADEDRQTPDAESTIMGLGEAQVEQQGVEL